jgi:transposase
MQKPKVLKTTSRWSLAVVEDARRMAHEGVKYKQISQRLGVPVNTLYEWITRGKRKVTVTERNKMLLKALNEDPHGTIHAMLAGHEALLADAIVQDIRYGEMWRASAVVADLLRGFAKEREQTQARAEQ